MKKLLLLLGVFAFIWAVKRNFPKNIDKHYVLPYYIIKEGL